MDRSQYIKFLTSLIQPLVILPNNLLWHYTDTLGLESIVRNQTMRLSHPGFLNDPSELQYANSVYDEMLDTLAGSQMLSNRISSAATKPTGIHTESNTKEMSTPRLFLLLVFAKIETGWNSGDSTVMMVRVSRSAFE